MNLLNVLKVMAVIVLLMVVSSLQAEQPTKDTDTEFISFVKIEGKTCVATSPAEFEQLKSLNKLINTCKVARSHGTIDSTEYAKRTASYFKTARESGLRVHN